ncbi:PREDICTED: E3 ubiquitin-protein ligase RNF19B-like isoform X2 [Sturnus vulgaris]|uniref:E3 ubiquitin-protein ligase RNF19B-like isoform X2 n=1 Tax=Sturnus vulgaris TaxID=9172 RepID=UPI00071A5759|nr:PREDICTED: E3 ubiquitin-protein ligase RNF19B-like isoform X2 [Sturnus vulgaris]
MDRLTPLLESPGSWSLNELGLGSLVNCTPVKSVSALSHPGEESPEALGWGWMCHTALYLDWLPRCCHCLPYAGDLGVLWSWTCHAELRETRWGRTGSGPIGRVLFELLWVPRACSQGPGSLSGAVPLQAEWQRLQLGMVLLLPVVRLRRKPQAVGGETPPEPEPEPEEPEETPVVLPLGEGQVLEECPLCLLPQPPEAFPSLASCSHRSCWACLQQYLCLAVRESRVPVSCPHCPAALQPSDVHRLLPEPALRDKYEEFLLRRLLVADPGTRWCPAPDCSYAVFAHGCAECPRLTCGREGCGTEFCYHCRQPWHPDGPCEPAPGLATPTAQLAQPEELAHAEAEDIKVCPRCSAFIMKINDGSCNRMNCTVCGCLFCWLCLREISDVHFLSPSGCTFWGKRPWSRTRRILWQLGMVLGAPMVISLAAGVAVPVITIGIPIYMGRKVLGQSRRSSLSRCQQCLSVTSSVLLSLFVSPIITALTVGIGVPLVLTYVYGTVVLSLCRSRWGCRGSRTPGDLGVVELDNLAKSAAVHAQGQHGQNRTASQPAQWPLQEAC